VLESFQPSGFARSEEFFERQGDYSCLKRTTATRYLHIQERGTVGIILFQKIVAAVIASLL
jgi:hypothetical protein